MDLVKYILRALLILLSILILVYLDIKTGENIELIAEFKFQTMDYIKGDSLDTDTKFELLDNHATRFSGEILKDTSNVREGLHYLLGVVGLLAVIELGFLLITRKTTDGQRETT